jgi:beta-galactosidase/beta-glucuronidase
MTNRSLSDIAREIRQDWKIVDFRAEPNLAAIENMNSINESYAVCEDHDNLPMTEGRLIVTLFLELSRSWQGATASRIKTELYFMTIRSLSEIAP